MFYTLLVLNRFSYIQEKYERLLKFLESKLKGGKEGGDGG